MLEYYAGELRKGREESRIHSMKEVSKENSLRNELAVLRCSLEGEIDLRGKRILQLEERVERRGREVGEKDRFIGEFLLRRVKDI